MLFSQKKDLEDVIVHSLLPGSKDIKQIHNQLPERSHVTLRAVYKAIDSLIEGGVVVKAGKKVWIDEEWLQKVRENLAAPVPDLSANEKTTYWFTSLSRLDSFWKTIAFQLESLERDRQIFFYNPHNFWAYMPERRESEQAYYSHFVRDKKRGYFVVGGSTYADMQFKRDHQNNFLQIDTRVVLGLSRRDHVTVLGEYVITAQLSQFLTGQIDEIYESGEQVDRLIPSIQKAAFQSGPVRLSIEHNPGKALRLSKTLSKNFFFPTD